MPQLIAGNWKMNCLCGRSHRRWPRRSPPAPPASRLICWSARPRCMSPPSPRRWRARPSPSAARIAIRRRTARIPATSQHPCCAMPARAWVILGHSERRQNHGETDELVREKTAGRGGSRADADRLRRRDRGPAQRRPGDRGRRLAARRQPAQAVRRRHRLRADLGHRHRQDRDRAGRRRRCTPSSARNWCASSARPGKTVRILYGGSVKAANAVVAAGGAGCRRRAGRRRQPERGGFSNDCPRRPGGLRGARRDVSRARATPPCSLNESFAR